MCRVDVFYVSERIGNDNNHRILFNGDTQFFLCNVSQFAFSDVVEYGNKVNWFKTIGGYLEPYFQWFQVKIKALRLTACGYSAIGFKKFWIQVMNTWNQL